MTVLDFHRIIEQDIQKMGFFAYADMETEEIDLQLNRQVDFLINGIIDKHFGRVLKINETQGFQKDQVSLDNLRTLHIRDLELALSEVPNKKELVCNLPNDYRHHIRSIAVIKYPCYNSNTKSQIDVTDTAPVIIQESQNYLKNHPFYKSDIDAILGEMNMNVLSLYGAENLSLEKIYMSYIKEPAKITYVKTEDGDYDSINSIQCDLDNSLHAMLARMTSIEIMKIIESNPQKIVSMQQDQV